MPSDPTIAFSCHQCSRQLRAPTKAAGRKAKCKSCGAAVLIPKPKSLDANEEHASTGGRKASSSNGVKDKTTLRSTPSGTGAKRQRRTSTPNTEIDLAGAIQEAGALSQQASRAAEAARINEEQITAAFSDRVAKKPVSFLYRIHLLLVACAMAALPVVYLALVIGAAYGEYFYIVNILPNAFSHAPRGRLAILYFGMVIAPAVAGFVVVLFLIKPLFFRIQGEGRRRSLTRKGEPILFHLVDKLCEATGAPKPTRIDVDYQVNASAQPMGGLLSVAAGKMVLTIGAPLITGLTCRQLTGVLAHEFGHFSQKIGMGATLLIHKINLWFTRVVYQRDSLDLALEDAIQESESWFGLILQLAQLCVFLSRGVLWCFMIVSHAISSALLRQMEFDADRYEYGVVGSKTFEETSHEIAILNTVQASALEDMFTVFSKGRLADDMMLILERTRKSISDSQLHSLKQANVEEEAGLFSSHPSNRARIEAASKANASGLFELDRPARDLIRHYKPLCKNVTWDFYRDHLGNRVSPKDMTRTEDLFAEPKEPNADSLHF